MDCNKQSSPALLRKFESRSPFKRSDQSANNSSKMLTFAVRTVNSLTLAGREIQLQNPLSTARQFSALSAFAPGFARLNGKVS